MQLLCATQIWTLYRSVDVEAIPQKRVVSDGRNHRMKPPIYRQCGPIESEGGSTVHQAWFAS